MTEREFVVAAALVLMLGACSEADEEPDSGAPPAEDDDGPADAASGSDDTMAMSPPDPGPAEVELADAGQDPQTALRLSPEVGDVTHLRIASDHETSGTHRTLRPTGHRRSRSRSRSSRSATSGSRPR